MARLDDLGRRVTERRSYEDRVKEWQRLLNQSGYRDQFGQPLAEDGILGPRTDFAMRSFLSAQTGQGETPPPAEGPLLVTQAKYNQAKLEIQADIDFERQQARQAAPRAPELTQEDIAQYIQGTGDTTLPARAGEMPRNLTTLIEDEVEAPASDELVRKRLAAIGLGKVETLASVFSDIETARSEAMSQADNPLGFAPMVARVLDPLGAPARWVKFTAAVADLVEQDPAVRKAIADWTEGRITREQYIAIREQVARRVYDPEFLKQPEVLQRLGEYEYLGKSTEPGFSFPVKSLNFVADIAMDPLSYTDAGTQPMVDSVIAKSGAVLGAIGRRAEKAVAPVVESAAERALVRAGTSEAAESSLKRYVKGIADMAPEARAGLVKLTRDATDPQAVRDALKLYGVEVAGAGEVAARTVGQVARSVVGKVPQQVQDLFRTKSQIEARKQAEAIPQHIMNVLKTGVDDPDALKAILNDPVLKSGLEQRGTELANYMARWRQTLTEVRETWEHAVRGLSEDERVALMTWMDQGIAIPANMGRVREVGTQLRARLDELAGDFYKEFYSYRGKVPRAFRDFVESWLPSQEGKRPWEFERTADRPHANFNEWLESQIYRDAVGRFDQAAQELRGLVESTAEFAQARAEDAMRRSAAARIASELGVSLDEAMAQLETAGKRVVSQEEWVAGLKRLPKGTTRFLEQDEWVRSLARASDLLPGVGVVDHRKLPAAMKADLLAFAREHGLEVDDWDEFWRLNPAADAFANEFEKATGHVLPRVGAGKTAVEEVGRTVRLATGKTARVQFGDTTDRLLFDLNRALSRAGKQEAKVQPGQALWIGRGKRGGVRVVFPDRLHADLYAFWGRVQRNIKEMGQGRGLPNWAAAEAKKLAHWFGVTEEELPRIASRYRESINTAIKGLKPKEEWAAPIVDEALQITTAAGERQGATKVAQGTRERLASLRGVLKERGFADPDAAARELGDKLEAWAKGEGKDAGAVFVSRDGIRTLGKGERVARTGATRTAAPSATKAALSPEVRAELARLKMPRSKRANIAVRTLRFLDSAWKDSVLLLRLGWPVRNVLDNTLKTANEILNAAARGEPFFPVFFGRVARDVPIPQALIEGGFHNAQKTAAVYGGAWQKVRDGLYEWMGARPESFFRSSVYRGKFLAEQARLLRAGIEPETAAGLARQYGVDEANRILNNYGNQVMAVHAIGRVSPFFNFRVYNWGYWIKDWARHPWKVTALLRLREDIRQANAGLPEYMRNTVELPDLPFIGPDQRIDPFAIWSYNDIVRLADAAPEWVKEREQQYQQAEDFANTLPAEQRTEFWRLNPDLAEYGRTRGITAVVKFTKWLETVLPLHPLLIRKPLEVVGILDKQDWRNIFAQTELIRQLTGLDIEKFHHAYLGDQDRKAVEQEVSRQKLRGEEPNEERAAATVREQALRREARGLMLGVYTKWWTPAHQEYYDASRAIFEGSTEAKPAPPEKQSATQFVTPEQVRALRGQGLTELEARVVAEMANRDKKPQEQRDAMETVISGYATVADLQVLTGTPKDRLALERILRKGPNVEDMTTLQRDPTMRQALENVLAHKSVAREFLAEAKTPDDLESLRQQLKAGQVARDILLQGRTPEERAVYDEIENEFREFAKLSTYAYKDRQLAFQKRQEYLDTHPLLKAVLDQSGTAQEKADRAKLEGYYRDYYAIKPEDFKNEFGDTDLGAFFAARRQYLKDHPEFQQLQLQGKDKEEQQRLLDQWQKDELWAAYPRAASWAERQAYLQAHPELLEETLKFRPAGVAVNWSDPKWREYKALKTDEERVSWLVSHPDRLKEWVLRQQGLAVVFDFEADKQKAWEQYFALPEDQRDKYIRDHPELGVYPLHPTQEEILERWKEQHPNEAAASQWYYDQGGKWKALLDLSTKVGMDRFWSTDPEWSRYRQEYFRKHPEKRQVMELTRQYWEMPPESRRRFLQQHPELEKAWQADATPEDKAMFALLDQYYAIPASDRARRRAFMQGHPDLQAWLDARQARKLEGMLTRLPAINEAMDMWLERTKAQLSITASRPNVYNPKGAVQSGVRPGSRGSR